MHCLNILSRIRINLHDLINALVYIFLFLAFMNFGTRNYYCFFIAFVFFVVAPKRKGVFDYSTLILFVFGLFIFAFDFDRLRGITDIFKPFVFLMAYFVGCSMAPKVDDWQNNMKHIERAVYLCAFGFFTHYALNFVYNIGSLERDTIDIWTKTVLSSTGQASLAIMGVAVIATVLFSKSSALQKIIASAIAIIIVSYNLILAGRTLLYMLAIAFLVAILFSRISQKKSFINIILTIGLIFIAVVTIYEFNLFGVRTIIEESNLYQRLLRKNGLGIADDLRFIYKEIYLENFFDHPFGGSHIRAECMHYAHDLYLDSYDAYGIFTLLALIAYMFSSFVRLVKGLRSCSVAPRIKQLLLCTFVLLNVQFCLEPIMDGMPFLLVAYCFVDGVLSRYLTISPRFDPC